MSNCRLLKEYLALWSYFTTVEAFEKAVMELSLELERQQLGTCSPHHFLIHKKKCHEVRPMNDPLQPHDCILLIVSLIVVQVFVF